MTTISYKEMCAREGIKDPQGMHFNIQKGYSVVLMSSEESSPYKDVMSPDGSFTYEGHDVPRNLASSPRMANQEMNNPDGTLTQNGEFYCAARVKEAGKPHTVKIYEKLAKNAWIALGFFSLTAANIEHDGKRKVFKFTLIPEKS